MTVSLRPWALSDAPLLAEYADNPRVAAHLRNVFPSPYRLEDAYRYILFCLEEDPSQQISRAILADGGLAGSITLSVCGDVHARSAELGYWLAEPFWGRGIMTQAVAQICREGWQAFPIVRIFAEPFAINQGSRRVLEHNGFQLEGIKHSSVWKNGRLLDSCMYALLREEK